MSGGQTVSRRKGAAKLSTAKLFAEKYPVTTGNVAKMQWTNVHLTVIRSGTYWPKKKSREATGDRTRASQLKVQHSNTWAIQEITDDQLNNRKEFETKLDNSLVHWMFRFPNGLILTKSCRSLQEICGILVCIKFQKLISSMQDPILTFSAGWNILLDAAGNLRDFYFWINFQKWISSININQINYFPAMFWGHSILQKRSKLGPICFVGT